MGCQVIGAGWCRTGTSSLQVALEALGFAPCFHSRLLPYLPGVRDACYEYSRGGAGKFPVERVFGRYRAAVDLPAALIPLLLDAYPDAKVPPCCVLRCLPSSQHTARMLIYTFAGHLDRVACAGDWYCLEAASRALPLLLLLAQIQGCKRRLYAASPPVPCS